MESYEGCRHGAESCNFLFCVRCSCTSSTRPDDECVEMLKWRVLFSFDFAHTKVWSCLSVATADFSTYFSCVVEYLALGVPCMSHAFCTAIPRVVKRSVYCSLFCDCHLVLWASRRDFCTEACFWCACYIQPLIISFIRHFTCRWLIYMISVHDFVSVCACVRARECLRARECVRECVRACVRACVCVCV